MNFIKKVYCRTYQTMLKMALPILPYRKPQLFHTINELPQFLKQKDIHCILLVTDKSVHHLGLTQPLEDLLHKEQINCELYDKTVANPTTCLLYTSRLVGT